MLRSELLVYAGEFEQAILLAQQVLDTSPRSWQLVRSYQMLILACAYQLRGDLPEAYSVLDAGLCEQHAHTEILHVRLASSGACQLARRGPAGHARSSRTVSASG